MKVLGIDHVVLRVVDLEASLAFYRDLLGCEVERRVESAGLVQLRAGASLIDLVPLSSRLGRRGGAGPGAEGRNVDHFCLRIEPFEPDALRARLWELGYSPSEVESVYGAEGTGPSIYVRDPDGNTVELKGPATARARRPMG